jgi:O-antigen biosynthesis protein
MTPLPAVSLIIGSRHRPAMLAETVHSILQGTDVPAELVIVDQSDTPHADLASLTSQRPCQMRYVWSQSVGLSRANNQGAAVARHDWLVFTHDDVLVEQDWWGQLVRTLVAEGPGTVISGRVLPSTTGRHGGFAPTLKVDPTPAVYQGRVGMDVLKPLNMALHRSALARVGGFDVRLGPGTPFPGAEDSDLGFRLLEAGYRIVYAPEAVVYHRAWRAEREYLPLRWRYGLAQGAFYAKHLKPGDLYMLQRLALDARRRARRWPRRVLTEPHRALADPLFLLGNLVGAIRWQLTKHSP